MRSIVSAIAVVLLKHARMMPTNGTVARRILNFWIVCMDGGASIHVYTVMCSVLFSSSRMAVYMYKNTFKSHALELGRSMMGLAGRLQMPWLRSISPFCTRFFSKRILQAAGYIEEGWKTKMLFQHHNGCGGENSKVPIAHDHLSLM